MAKQKVRHGFALRHISGRMFIAASDDGFACYSPRERDAYLFPTREAAERHKGTFLTEYEVVPMTIYGKRVRLGNFCQPYNK